MEKLSGLTSMNSVLDEKYGEEGKTMVLFTTHAGNRFCKTLRTAQDILAKSPVIQGLDTHEDEVSTSEASITKWLIDNGLKKE